MNKTLLFPLIIITFIIGIMVGFGISPEYQNLMKSKSVSMPELGNPDKWLDLRFINGVIGHHLIAIDMAKQALANSKRSEITSLANEIIVGDEKSISDLYGIKLKWYQDSRKVTKYEKVNLGTYDANFDLRFLNALINHHDSAIEMTAEIQTKSTRNEILSLASITNAALKSGVLQFKSWRQSWYSL